MLNVRRLPLVQQTLIGVIVLCCVVGAALSTALYFHAESVAREESNHAMKTQTDLIYLVFTMFEKNILQEAEMAIERVKNSLPPSPGGLTGKHVRAGDIDLPELMFGGVSVVDNQKFLSDYKRENPLEDVDFLVRMGDSLYWGSTLLKDDRGQYRIGEKVTDGYTSALLDGSPYFGTINRAGRLYAVTATPMKDAGGRVIGAITVRVNIEESFNGLKNQLQSVVLGKTGYMYAISISSGDQVEPVFVIHPTYTGQNLSSVPDNLREIAKRIIQQKTGFIHYQWEISGKTEEKIAAFSEIPTLHWIAVASAPMAEYTDSYTGLIRWVLIALTVTILVLVLCLWAIIRHQLRPIDRIVQALKRLGKGDLSLTLDTDPQSRNEIDVLSTHVNDSCGAMKRLVGAIRESSSSVADAASHALGDTQNLSDNIAQLSSTTSEVSRSIEELSSAINEIAHTTEVAHGRVEESVHKVAHGKEVVKGVTGSIQVIEERVQSSLTEVERLTEYSRNIETVVTSIGAIAGQTNLLALNAAIEAARAGEVGRGFAVVADEVRKLAEESAQSANEIGKILDEVTTGVGAVRTSIDAVVAETRKGTQASGSASEALTVIESITRDLFDSINVISQATTEQASAALSMTDQVNSAASVAGQTSQVARNVAQTATGLKTETDKLDREISHFRV